MIDKCPWCYAEYDITPYTEVRHLLACDAFQHKPIVKWVNNRPYVSLDSGEDHFLVEKTPMAKRVMN